MIQGAHLTDFQVEVARQFFRLEESKGYVVAGGAGMLASGLIDRSTQDLDLFGSAAVVGGLGVLVGEAGAVGAG